MPGKGRPKLQEKQNAQAKQLEARLQKKREKEAKQLEARLQKKREKEAKLLKDRLQRQREKEARQMEVRLQRERKKEADRIEREQLKIWRKNEREKDRQLKAKTKFRFVHDISTDSEAEVHLVLSNYANIKIYCPKRCSDCRKAKDFFDASFGSASWTTSGDKVHSIYIDGKAYSNLQQAKRASLPAKGGVQDKLQSHQQTFFDFYTKELSQGNRKPFLLYWTVGSGKTEGSLAPFFKDPPRRLVIVCYKSLVKYWQQKVMTFRILSETKKDFVVEIMTFQTLQKDVDISDAHVIVDEVQFYRNMTTNMLASLEALRNSQKLLVLTATPLVNDAGKEMLLWQTLFGHSVGALDGRVFYFNPRSFNPESFSENYPQVEERIIPAPMSWEQVFYYFYYESNSVSFAGYDFQTPHRNYMSSKLRSACNAVKLPDGQLISSKLDVLLNVMETDLLQRDLYYPKVIYSSNIETGVDAILDRISNLQLRVEAITGKTDMHTRNRIVNNFNGGGLDVLVISKVGNTGLNLMGTMSMDITSPHDNLESEKQTKGRVVRYESHKGMVDPIVIIRKYVCKFPTNRPVEASPTFKYILREFFRDEITFTELIKDLENKIKYRPKSRLTVEEAIMQNNKKKAEEIDFLLKTFKQATIPFPGYEAMLDNERALLSV